MPKLPETSEAPRRAAPRSDAQSGGQGAAARRRRGAFPAQPGVIGLAGLILAWAGASAAYGAVGTKVEQGIEACLPMLSGEAAEEVAPQFGLKREGRAWVLSGAGAKVELAPPGQANPQVCALYVAHEPDQAQDILDGVDAWATAPARAMARVRDQETTAGGARLTSVWAGRIGGQDLDVVLSKDAAPSDGDRESMIVITAR